MREFSLLLHDARRSETIEGVTSFVGEDASGSFGILAGQSRLVTALVFGLARFRVRQEPWQYLAVPGAVLYFHDNSLTVTTRRYLLDSDYDRITTLLQEQLVQEEEQLQAMKKSLANMEDEVLKRLWRLGHQAG